MFEGNLLYSTFSAITAISTSGPLLCHIYTKETITAEKFMLFFKELVMKMGDEQCCFFLDNAAVHSKEDLIDFVRQRNQAILFNVPYSCETNPIEHFFSVWKGFVRDKSPSLKSTEELKSVLKQGFNSISAGACQRIIRHTLTETYQKVLRGEDL